MTETYTATVDRIVDGRTAVVLLEHEERTDGRSGEDADRREGERDGGDGDAADRPADPVEQLEVGVTQLPADARHDGAVLEVVVDDGTLREASYRPDETASRRESAQERLDRLSERLSDRD